MRKYILRVEFQGITIASFNWDSSDIEKKHTHTHTHMHIIMPYQHFFLWVPCSGLAACLLKRPDHLVKCFIDKIVRNIPDQRLRGLVETMALNDLDVTLRMPCTTSGSTDGRKKHGSVKWNGQSPVGTSQINHPFGGQSTTLTLWCHHLFPWSIFQQTMFIGQTHKQPQFSSKEPLRSCPSLKQNWGVPWRTELGWVSVGFCSAKSVWKERARSLLGESRWFLVAAWLLQTCVTWSKWVVIPPLMQ